MLQGNCDAHFSVEHKNIDNMDEQEQKRIKWNQSLINKEDREYLLKLPFSYEFYMSGSLVRLFHATPTVNKRNKNKDSNVLETTKSNYLIIEGEYGSREYLSDISYQFIKVPYNIDKELEDENLNIEKENYRFELQQGMYRDMTKINDNFRRLGIDVDNI